MIQAEHIIVEKEYINTKLDSFTKEETTYKQICMEVINLEIEKNKGKQIGEQIVWKLENNIWKKNSKYTKK